MDSDAKTGLTLFATGLGLGAGSGLLGFILFIVAAVCAFVSVYHAYHRYSHRPDRWLFTIGAGLFWPIYLIYLIYQRVSK